MYKDREKAKETARERMRRFRNKGVTPVTPPGDVTPDPVTPSVTPSHKRGTDIKCFEDLPADVQLDIVTMAASKAGNDEVAYQRERQDRTERAIHYQHTFPDRFYAGGREVGEPLPALEHKRQGPGQGITQKKIILEKVEYVIPEKAPLVWNTPPDVVERLTDTGVVAYDEQGRPHARLPRT